MNEVIYKLLQLVADTSQAVMDLEAQLKNDPNKVLMVEVAKDLEAAAVKLKNASNQPAAVVSVASSTAGHNH